MPRPILTEADNARIVSLHAAGKSYHEMALQFGVTAEAIRSVCRRTKIPKEFDPTPLPDPLHLHGDFIVVGDVHVPYTNWEFAKLVGRVAEKTGIRRLVIGGDFFNLDSFSRYQHACSPATWAQERDAARVLIADWLEVFQDIYIVQGNHDRRLTNWTAAELDEGDIWGMINTSTKLHHTPYGYCVVTSNGVDWRITHPANYGRNQLTVMSDIANKYGSNVIGYHEHHAAQGWDVYKRWVIVNGGSLVDPCKLAYVALDDNRMAGMAAGFVVLRNGVANVLGAHPFTDWAQWLN